MKSLHSLGKLIFGFFFIISITIVPIANAQPDEQYIPKPYQEGKDVVWVPTPQALVDRMLDMANVTPQDYVIDLGSGDGRIVITAAKRGARAHGIEYNPKMVELSRLNASREGVSDRATFEEADLFESDFSQATVITLFLLGEINMQLRPKILGLKPGTRVVSNSFDMGEWEADKFSTADKDCSSFCTAYFWIVPSKAGGIWKLPQGELTLEQTFQNITGTLRFGEKSIPVRGKLAGDEILFTADGVLYSGRVSSNSMEGEIKGRENNRWTATRIQQ
jgi:hypothetical protein